jgi:hypothetical protein
LSQLNVSLLDVIYIDSIPVEEATHGRPAIVVRITDGLVTLAPCSSAWEIYQECHDFPFLESDPNTKAMGFKRLSYAIDTAFVVVDASAIKKVIGHLGGELADNFMRWARGEDPRFLQ